MTKPNNISNRKKEILAHLTMADYDQATKRLIDFYQDFCPEQEMEAIKLASQWNALKQKIDGHLVDFKEETVARNQIIDALTQQLDKAIQYAQVRILSPQHLEAVEAVADKMLFMKDGTLEQIKTKNQRKNNLSYRVFEVACDSTYAVLVHSLLGLFIRKLNQVC